MRAGEVWELNNRDSEKLSKYVLQLLFICPPLLVQAAKLISTEKLDTNAGI